MRNSEALIQEAEILDWWGSERQKVTDECVAMRKKCVDWASGEIEDLSANDLLRNGAARKHIQRQIESDINMFNRRMEQKLKESCEASLAKIEGAANFQALGGDETATLAVSGVLAAGAVGVAATAAGVATTSTIPTVLAVFVTGTTVTFSWPVFSVAAALAVAAAVASPKVGLWSLTKLRKRYSKHIEDFVQGTVMEGENASRKVLLDTLDQAKDHRLREVSKGLN